MSLYCISAQLTNAIPFAYLINVRDGKLMHVHKPMRILSHIPWSSAGVLDAWLPDRPGEQNVCGCLETGADWLLGRMVLPVDNTDPYPFHARDSAIASESMYVSEVIVCSLDVSCVLHWRLTRFFFFFF
jgi:hypothetical protein